MTPSRLRVAHLNDKYSVKHFPQKIRISQTHQTPSLAEEKLRLYERAIAATGNGIVISDAKQPGLPIVYCNPAFEKITGYSKSEVLGKNCRFLQGNDTDPVAIGQIRQALHEGRECCVVLKNYRKDGTAFWNELTISPVRDASGCITHFIGVQNDITKHKEAEEFLQKTNEELEKRVEERADSLKKTNEKLRREISDREWIETARRQSEVRFRSIFEKAAIGISMMDMSGYIIISNPTLQKILGYSGRDLQNMKFTDFTHADDLAYNLELFNQLVAGERDYYQIEKRYYRKDGELVWAHVTISLVRDLTGKPKFCISMVEDITKRKQTEEALKLSQERLKFLLCSSPAVIYSCKADGDYRVTFMSENVLTMLGYEAREFMADPSFWAKHIHADDPVPIFADISELFDKDYYIQEYRFRHQDGTYRWMYDQIKLIRDPDGNPLEIIGYWSDITDRKLAEAERSRLTTILESCTDFVGLADLQGNILWNNNQMKKVIQIEQDSEVKQHRIPDYHPQWALDIVLNEGLPIAMRDGVWVGETALLNKEGKEIPVSQMILSHKNDRGVIEYCSTLMRDITPLKQAEERLKTSLKEKEVLLKEIHHRVKNNLQVISSLLKLQSTYIDDPETLALFTDSQNRVKAMALIHEKLYQSSDLAHIHAGDYIRNLAKNLFQSYSVNLALIELKIEVDDIYIDVDTAIPCGLIINELLCNSLKYAFPKERQGKIYIGFHLNKDKKFNLKISDNGIGLPPDFNIEEIESLGLQLVWNLTEQLDGKLNVDSSQGTTFAITFGTTT